MVKIFRRCRVGSDWNSPTPRQFPALHSSAGNSSSTAKSAGSFSMNKKAALIYKNSMKCVSQRAEILVYINFLVNN